MFNTLSYIAKNLNKENINWGVGASILLNQHGLIDKPNDIDIIVDLNDIEKADEILQRIGEKKAFDKTAVYSTEYFYEYIVNGIDVDVMAGLRINSDAGVFKYAFDKSSVVETREINGETIPLTSLEDWYVIYQLIPNRDTKVKLIENYLLLNGVKCPSLLERILVNGLPEAVREKVKNILKHNKIDS